MHFNLQAKYFLQIKQGLKTAEGRINKPKFAKLELGDIITFSHNNGSEVIKAQVTYVKRFSSFKEMLKDDIKSLLPDVKDVEAGVKIYESFGSYRQDQAEFGTISIGFKLI